MNKTQEDRRYEDAAEEVTVTAGRASTASDVGQGQAHGKLLLLYFVSV